MGDWAEQRRGHTGRRTESEGYRSVLYVQAGAGGEGGRTDKGKHGRAARAAGSCLGVSMVCPGLSPPLLPPCINIPEGCQAQG